MPQITSPPDLNTALAAWLASVLGDLIKAGEGPAQTRADAVGAPAKETPTAPVGASVPENTGYVQE